MTNKTIYSTRLIWYIFASIFIRYAVICMLYSLTLTAQHGIELMSAGDRLTPRYVCDTYYDRLLCSSIHIYLYCF